MRDWKEYFRNLLGGVERRVVMGGKRKRKREGEKIISREEVRRVTKKLKEKKAMGMDGVPNEVWKYKGEKMVK